MKEERKDDLLFFKFGFLKIGEKDWRGEGYPVVVVGGGGGVFFPFIFLLEEFNYLIVVVVVNCSFG